ncbi:MAG: 23S rRNA (guanine(745)-N(1))-methyltransferase [Colwellia sp.]|nr:23S rRNA (guanine(745)-N(1))-methyltransferase [Colwellia sp.]
MISKSYQCPLCQQVLVFNEQSYRCTNNHSFDQAKEGYVNLLPVQHKHSKDPGDNKAMVNARRAFLDLGFYQPLVKAITELQIKFSVENAVILDAGCGEGYYTHQHKNDLNQVYGVDIAKNAVKIAAKRYKACSFSVGTLSNLPFDNEIFGWVFSIYAPILEEEFTRVLKTQGYLLTVTPAENHLIELKSLIYRQANKHDVNKSPISNLTMVHEQQLNYQMNFNNSDDLINLLSMTPFAFKTSPELLEELANKESFTCQADFLIRLYQKI